MWQSVPQALKNQTIAVTPLAERRCFGGARESYTAVDMAALLELSGKFSGRFGVAPDCPELKNPVLSIQKFTVTAFSKGNPTYSFLRLPRESALRVQTLLSSEAQLEQRFQELLHSRTLLANNKGLLQRIRDAGLEKVYFVSLAELGLVHDFNWQDDVLGIKRKFQDRVTAFLGLSQGRPVFVLRQSALTPGSALTIYCFEQSGRAELRSVLSDALAAPANT